MDRLVQSMGKKIELEVPSFFPLLPFRLIIYHPLIGLTNVFCLLPLTLKPGITNSGPTSCPFICVCVCVARYINCTHVVKHVAARARPLVSCGLLTGVPRVRPTQDKPRLGLIS